VLPATIMYAPFLPMPNRIRKMSRRRQKIAVTRLLTARLKKFVSVQFIDETKLAIAREVNGFFGVESYTVTPITDEAVSGADTAPHEHNSTGDSLAE
jgi:hypothetical protein